MNKLDKVRNHMKVLHLFLRGALVSIKWPEKVITFAP